MYQQFIAALRLRYGQSDLLRDNLCTMVERLRQRFDPLSIQESDGVNAALMTGCRAKIREVPEGEVELVQHFNIPILKRNICSLVNGKWLDDEIISFYCKMLQERDDTLSQRWPGRRKSYFYNSYFMKLLRDTPNFTNSVYNYERVKRWSRKFPIFEMERVYCPININGIHWTLLVVFVQEKKIRYYDSLGGTEGYERYSKAALHYMKDEHHARLLPFHAEQWERINVQNIPRQANGFDCGVFIIMYMDFLSEDIPMNFQESDNAFFRRKICASVLRKRLKYT